METKLQMSGGEKNHSLEIQNMMEWKQNRNMHFTTQRGSCSGKWFGITAPTVWTFPPQQGTLPNLKEADEVIRPTSTPSTTEVSRGTRPGFLQQLFICITVASRSTSPRLKPSVPEVVPTLRKDTVATAVNSSRNKQENQADRKAPKWDQYIQILCTVYK